MRTFVLTAFILNILAANSVFAKSFLLKNGNVVDPSTQTIIQSDILIENGKITGIGKSIKNEGAVELDLSGKWIMPGLIDTHVHAYANSLPKEGAYHYLGVRGSAQSMLYVGITAFLDLFNSENLIFGLRDQQRSGAFIAENVMADIFAAGPIFTCTNGHGTEYPGVKTRVIDSPEDAEREISDLAKRHPDVIKIVYDHNSRRFPTLNSATLKKAIEVANGLGLKTVIHIGFWRDAEEAIDYGATAITHTHAFAIPTSLIEKMKYKKVVYIPTLTVQMDLNNIVKDQTLLARPLLTELVPAPALTLYTQDPTHFSDWARLFLKLQESSRTAFQRNFKTLLDAGIQTLAGTDAGNVGTFQGYSLHRELEMMVEAGATPWQAIKSATVDAGKFLGIVSEVNQGAVANLLILNKSPLDDIKNTQDIFAVFYHGEPVDRLKLREEIAKSQCSGCE